jgi:hypothetical protein
MIKHLRRKTPQGPSGAPQSRSVLGRFLAATRFVGGAAALCLLADAASAQITSTGRINYALQPDGTYNIVELFSSTPALTYSGALGAAPTLGGHLATPRSRDENSAMAGLINDGQGAWIGLDDTDAPGGTGENQWSLIDDGAGREIIWTGVGSGSGGLPVAGKYHNWNGAGEPNNSNPGDPTGEDAAEMLGNGYWNDLSHDNTGFTRNFIVEYPTNLASKPDPAPGLVQAAPGNWNIRKITGSHSMGHVNGVDVALYSGIGTTVDYQSPTINFRDQNSGDGMIGGGSFFPGDDPGNADENNFAIYARGQILITEESDYTFGFSGDDGAELQVHGQNFTSSVNIGDAANVHLLQSNIPTQIHVEDRIAYPNPTGNGAVLGVVHLTPGKYDLTYKFYENGGGAHAEVFAAKGAHTSMNTEFNVIGGAPNAPVLSAPTVIAPFASGEAGVDVPGWDVVRVNGPNSIAASITAIEAVFADPVNTPNNGYEVSQTINYADDIDGGGNIGVPQVVFPGNIPGVGENDFAIGAVTVLTVNQTGRYRFTVLGDDGSQFRLLGSNAGGWTADGIAAVDSNGDGMFIGSCCADGHGYVNLTEGEVFQAQLIWNEIGGGAYVNVRYSIDPDGDGTYAGNFLLGSAEIGGGRAAGLQLVPEPSSFVLAGFGLAGLLVGMRRRRK